MGGAAQTTSASDAPIQIGPHYGCRSILSGFLKDRVADLTFFFLSDRLS